ncbi:uncharacterized protein B0I36DRAFT_329700 [Microdochium trichocladiopsis]|uniref:Uncharacterized protein n=1 Tax=Microdochium trichocladiopsis TaxID=1682393 RepID=A0A9P8XZG8_9PEZI|nr:uncharacterized protein B0I36DRAFT_329700 [Microdochium trichocladiopsis]KAH7026014.1 hypothetical protein B0I36DRAFT_329700 [Microdochium trichocladiopsis]
MSQLFGRVRNKLSGSQADIDPHHWRLPPAASYTATKNNNRSGSDNGNNSTGKKQSRHTPLIPNPKIFKNAFIPPDPEAGLGTPSRSGTGLGSSMVDVTNNNDAPIYPDVSHAAVHLALLECFHDLRHSADALDIENLRSHTTHHLRQQQHHPPTYSEKPRPLDLAATGPGAPTPTADNHDGAQKWDLLVRLAVDRFGVWWRDIAKVLQHASVYTHLRHPKAAVQLGENYLPPLDVLLVWYVFMLHGDGDAYASACRDHRDVPRLQHLCFPWEALRSVIDTNSPGRYHHPLANRVQSSASSLSSPSSAAAATVVSQTAGGHIPVQSGFAYNLPRAAQALFRTLSSQDADVAAYLKKPPPYVEDHSPFAFDGIDLYREVKKLFGTRPSDPSSITSKAFVDESHDLLWIRSPSLVGTLDRNSRQYFECLLSGQLDPSTMSHPAEDDPLGDFRLPFGLELLWRTHRLYPIQYRLFYEAKLGQVLSGQRLLPEENTTLMSGFDGGYAEEIEETVRVEQLDPRASVTSRATRKKAMCLCWTCERIRDDAPDFAYFVAPSRMPSWPMSPLHQCSSSSSSASVSSASMADDPMSTSTSSTPASSPSSVPSALVSDATCYDPSHIQGLSGDQLRRIQDDIAFYRAVESKRRAGESLPTRTLTAAEKEAVRKAKENRYIPGV